MRTFRIFIAWLVCLGLIQSTRSDVVVVIGRGVAAGGSPTIQINTDAATDFWFYYSNAKYYAQKFTTTGAFTATRVDVQLFKFGTLSAGNMFAEIWTDNAGSPGALVGTGSGAVDRTTLGAVFEAYDTFNGLSATLAATTSYWLVVRSSVQDVDTSNSLSWIYGNGVSAPEVSSDDGSTWSSLGNGNLHFKLWGN